VRRVWLEAIHDRGEQGRDFGNAILTDVERRQAQRRAQRPEMSALSCRNFQGLGVQRLGVLEVAPVKRRFAPDTQDLRRYPAFAVGFGQQFGKRVRRRGAAVLAQRLHDELRAYEVMDHGVVGRRANAQPAFRHLGPASKVSAAHKPESADCESDSFRRRHRFAFGDLESSRRELSISGPSSSRR
jgi:hypothetical protein